MLRKAMASLCILFGAVLAAHAQARPVPNNPATFTLRGRIVVEGAQPDGIEVRLERTEMQPIATAFSDGLGNFEFRNLQPANYYVAVKLNGYEDVRQLVPYVPSNVAPPVSIFMVREPFKVVEVHRGTPVVDVAELNRNYPKKALDEYEAAQEDIRKGNPAKAAERLEAAVALAPDFYSAHNSLGIAYQKLSRYRDGESEFNRWILS
jgi:tetratricopeptide (TPR) repeat protein